jgi:outer membrane protein assembly factor BamB
VFNGVVYFGSDDSYLYALNASTGAQLWRHLLFDKVQSSPAVAHGVVYVGGYALNARTGALLFDFRDESSPPTVANGVVYVGSWDNNIYALNASTGALLWKYATGSEVWDSPAVANGRVYVGSLDGSVYAFGLTASDAPALPERPDPQTLSPDLSLPLSRPSAKLPATDE